MISFIEGHVVLAIRDLVYLRLDNRRQRGWYLKPLPNAAMINVIS